MTSPGGMLGRGVNSQILASGSDSSHRAAFSRAVGKMIAVLMAPSVRARSTKLRALLNGGLVTTLKAAAYVLEGHNPSTCPLAPDFE
jgi:hypothetical protein